MRKLLGIILLFMGIVQLSYSQHYSKSFLLNNLNTVPDNLTLYDNKIFTIGIYPDTTLISGIGIKSYVSKFKNDGTISNYITYRPEQYFTFTSSINNGKSFIINDNIITCGYSEDTGTGNRSYLVCFYDSNLTLLNYFAVPTGTTYGGLTSTTYSNNYFYSVGKKGHPKQTVFLKLDTLGNKIRELNYSIITTANDNLAQTILAIDSGDLLIAIGGHTEFLPGSGQLHSLIYKTTLIRADSIGGQKWQWTDTSNNGQAPYSFQKTSDGGYISCGSYVGYRAYNDTDDYALYMPYVVKWNSNFTKQWENYKTPIDIGYRQGIMYDVKELSDGSFIACGVYSEGSVYGYIVKINASGDIIWSKQYRSYQFPETYSQHRLYDLDVLSNGDIVAVGEINPNDGISIPQQGWILRVDSNGCIVDSNWCGWNSIEVEPTTHDASQAKNELFIYPNPVTDLINISINQLENMKIDDYRLEIYDAIGKKQSLQNIEKETTLFGELKFQVNIKKLISGMYFIHILDKDNKVISNGKFIKE
ncbi:MAG: T9SS type A sorting domain-containing protein [Bacteroidota bacterium]